MKFKFWKRILSLSIVWPPSRRGARFLRRGVEPSRGSYTPSLKIQVWGNTCIKPATFGSQLNLFTSVSWVRSEDRARDRRSDKGLLWRLRHQSRFGKRHHVVKKQQCCGGKILHSCQKYWTILLSLNQPRIRGSNRIITISFIINNACCSHNTTVASSQQLIFLAEWF